MRASAPEPRDIVARAAVALARSKAEAVPRATVAVLRAAFAVSGGDVRCDVITRRRRGDRREWASVATRPLAMPALSCAEAERSLPPAGLHVRQQDSPPDASPGLPGQAHLDEQGLMHRLAFVLKTPDLKAILSVARATAFTEADAACMARLGAVARGPLVTWARVERFRRALHRARFVQRLLADATRSMDAAALAEASLRRLREQAPVDRLLLVEPPGDGTEIAAWSAAPGEKTVHERHAGRAASRARRDALAEAVAVADLSETALGPWQVEARDAGFRSLLLLPLPTRRKPEGAMILLSRQPHGLGAEHLSLLGHVARPLASALERALLFREVSERSRQMTALYEVGQALNSPLDTAGVTERVLSALHDAFRFQHSAVLTLETRDDGEWLVMQASRGYSLRDDSGFRMRVGDRGVTSRAVRTGRIVYVPDVRQDPHYVKGVEAGRSEVAVPLLLAGRVIGVLDVESTQLNAFSAGDLETLQLFSTQVALSLERARSFDDVRRQAMTDGLTGLLNQRYFKEKVDRELDRSRGTGRPFALALIDIDDFKRVNDEHGHVVGDQVITAMGDALRARVRSIDAAARFGGDEFALILSEADLARGLRVASDLARDVTERRPAGISVSLSIGVAEWTPALITFRDVVNAADRALYRAKAQGKGRVVEAGPQDAPP